MSFKLLGVYFEVSVPFVIILAFLLVTDKTGLMSASLAAVILHEIGHLVAMRAVKCAPKRVKFSAAGVLISGSVYCAAFENIIIAISGPVFNFIFSVVFYTTSKLLNSQLMLAFCVVQFLVGAVNMLPVKGLDGGIVMTFLLSKLKIKNVGFAASLISIVTACAMLVLGVGIAVKNVSNPSLILLGIYLIILNVLKS